jgi:hypothetical protein
MTTLFDHLLEQLANCQFPHSRPPLPLALAPPLGMACQAQVALRAQGHRVIARMPWCATNYNFALPLNFLFDPKFDDIQSCSSRSLNLLSRIMFSCAWTLITAQVTHAFCRLRRLLTLSPKLVEMELPLRDQALTRHRLRQMETLTYALSPILVHVHMSCTFFRPSLNSFYFFSLCQ